MGDWLPPKPPTHFTGAVPQRPLGEPQRPAPEPDPPSSPLAISGIALASGSLLLLLFSLGAMFFASALLALGGLSAGRHAGRRIAAGVPGRPSQARAAITLAGVGLALAFVAGIVWMILDANGVSPEDLQKTLED